MSSAARRPAPLLAAVLCAGPLASAVVRGGFTASSQVLLVALVAAAAVVGVNLRPLEVIRSARDHRAAGVLAALGVVSAASAVWTVGAPADAVREGLVLIAVASASVLASTFTTRFGPRPIVVALVALAIVEALLGLGSAALHALPDAERIGRVWQPGGTFEYPLGLALLEVGALPALMLGARGRGSVSAVGAGGALLAGAVVGCAGSRLGLGLAALTVVLVLMSARGEERAELALLSVLAGLAGVLANRLLAQPVGAGAPGSPARLALLLGALVLVALAWGRRPRWRSRTPDRRVIAVGLGVVAALAVVGVITTPGTAGRLSAPGGLSHGRLSQWRAAAQTWLDRPVLGAGAGSYFIASAPHQGTGRSLFAHELPLETAAELGVPGLGLTVALYAAVVALAWRARRRRAAIELVPLALVFLLANLVDWPWHLWGLTAVWSLAVGALHALGSADAAAPAAAMTRESERR